MAGSIEIDGIRITEKGAEVPPGTEVRKYPDGHYEVWRDGEMHSTFWPGSYKIAGLDVDAVFESLAAPAVKRSWFRGWRKA